ncbi:hypothetical protein FNW25_00975 [Flavobacterium franklandianum]|uniref:Lipocalin-like domain-containing protein n=1 Tax=Flavobacterium bomense TaxID=2497483 RepID=A0A3S0MER0_9FLAO|nr:MULTISPECIES: hypothetical protein [Flavobacterium]RTZ01307.1 hypothetical protein EKL98_15190 [Flavobacterium bomense]TRX30100.1 hypothetical protein FNW25_00975 [Flavobacterium franklandianum]
MKNIKIMYLLLASFMLIFSACEPIVDETSLVDSTNVEGVQLVATQSTPGGNKVTLKMVTPGITGYWNFNLGKALTNEVTVVYPIPGKNTFTYVGTLGSQFFSKTIDVQIDKLDTPLNQDWYDLVSNNTATGKTWVFDRAVNLWWFMSAPNNPDGAMGAWWDANNCCPPSDAGGKMHFDLNGAANFNHYETTSATPKKGSFVLDVPNKKLIITGSKMLGYSAGNKDGVYQIIELTPTKMVLYLSNNEANGTGWTFVFKPL